jgi:pimeloyl-ACP methyl ester carboxylesterase
MTTAMGVPRPFLLLMRLIPGMWSKLVAMAHTLPYDQAVMGDTLAGRPLTASEWAPVRARTLVIDGGKSPAQFRNAAEALVAILPDARRHTLEGRNHGVVEMAPKAIAPVLLDFFGE